jgi:hypothetical protein
MNQWSSISIAKQRKIVLGACITAALLTFGTMEGTAQKLTVPKPQSTVALRVAEIKQLLFLMDTDKNGRISKKEFLSFMEAEFDRLDTSKTGQLNVSELKLSQVRPSRSAPPVGK